MPAAPGLEEVELLAALLVEVAQPLSVLVGLRVLIARVTYDAEVSAGHPAPSEPGIVGHQRESRGLLAGAQRQDGDRLGVSLSGWEQPALG